MIIALSFIIPLVLVGVSYMLWFMPASLALLWQLPLAFLLSYLVWVLLLVLVLIVIAICIPIDNVKKPKYFLSYLMIQISDYLIFLFGIKLVIEGKENLPQDAHYMVIGNHQSNMDPILLVSILRNPNIAMIMKDNILKFPFLRRWLLSAGYLPLDRNNDRKAIEAVIKGIRWIEDGYTFGAFPEGTRSKKGVLLPFRSGIFKVAQKARCPILVFTMDGVYKIKKNFPLVPTKIYIKIHPMIEFETFEHTSTVELGENIRNLMKDTIQEARSKYTWLYTKKELEDKSNESQ